MATNVKTYLLSLLTYQFLAKEDAFAQRHPHCWLVWEPGAWSPPVSLPEAQSTRLPSEKANTPTTGDALCFELEVRPGQDSLSVGRAQENALVINDATVSREHLVLHRLGDGWAVQALAGAKGCKLDGRALTPGPHVRLNPGARLEMGHVHLTFHAQDDFRARVAEAARKLRK